MLQWKKRLIILWLHSTFLLSQIKAKVVGIKDGDTMVVCDKELEKYQNTAKEQKLVLLCEENATASWD